jgi:hypothetical protein
MSEVLAFLLIGLPVSLVFASLLVFGFDHSGDVRLSNDKDR